MKIRFLTSSTEPGKNGIGDYTLRLASQCEKRGHAVEIVAFNDKHISKTIAEPNALRLPKGLAMKDRLAEFSAWSAGRSKPDWASVQFVPYGFDDKGMVRAWREPLVGFVAEARPHLMVHETWIGQEKSAPLRHRFVGALQKGQVLRMFAALRPRMIHTSNEFYAGILREANWPAKILPLAGNIPIQSPFSEAERDAFFQKVGIANRGEICLIGLFGAIYPEWKPRAILPALRDAAAKAGKRLALLSFGRIGPGQPVWDAMKAEFEKEARFVQLGELPPAEISAVLQEADGGLCVSTYELLGKSSATATMIEHGLPVIVSRFENTREPADPPPGLITPATADRLFDKSLRPPRRDPGATAEQFLADLRDAA